MTDCGFQAECLRRLDRIEALLEHLAGDVEARLLRQVARVVGSNAFVAAEITALAETDTKLCETLAAAVGLPSATRRLGWLLGRSVGRSIGGVSVERLGDCDRGAIWRVSTKPIEPLAPRLHAVQHEGTNERG